MTYITYKNLLDRIKKFKNDIKIVLLVRSKNVLKMII